MTVINTNVGALTARTYAIKANDAMQGAMERLSSGLRINSAADDAAGLAVANKMESQLRGMNVAIRNSQDGISLVQTAESGMSEISNMVVRMRELAVQMNNGVYTNADRKNAQLEVSALLAEIDKIAGNTAFNDVKVLDGTYVKDIRAGNTNAESISVAIDAMDTKSMGGAVVTTGVKTVGAGTNAVNSSAVDVAVVVAGTGENFTLAVSELSTNIQAKTGGYFAIEAFTSASVANKFQVEPTGGNAGNVSTKVGETLEAGESYVFNVVYKSTADNSVLYTDKVTITAADYTPAPSTTTTVTLTAEEAKDISLTPTSVMSVRFKEYVTANAGGAYTISSGNDQADFSVDPSTGVISKGTASGATFDFENPLDSNTDNAYTFALTYTDLRGGVFTETVTLNVTDNATNDVATVHSASTTAASKRSTAGESSFTHTEDGTSAQFTSFDFTATSGTAVSAGLVAFNADAAHTSITYALLDSDGTSFTGTKIQEASGSDGTIEVEDNMPAGTTSTFMVRATDATTGNTYDEVVTVVTSNGSTASNLVAVSTGGTAAEMTIGAGVTLGGEDFVVDLASMLTAGDSTNGFAALDAWRTANSGGTMSYVISGSASNPTGTATPTVAADGKVTLAGAGYVNAGTSSITVTVSNGSKSFDQTLKVDWSAVTDANASDQASSTVAFSSVPAIVGTSSEEVIGGKSTLSVVEARQANIKAVGTNAVLSAELATFVGKAANAKGTYSLTGTDAASFSVNEKTGDIESVTKMDFESKASYDFNLVYTKGAKVYTENIALSVTNDEADDVAHVADIDMSTSEGAAAAVTVLDTALNTISSAQAKLGAIQNRLQHNIDNLSMASMLTETARGRIVDADFARETSELSKQQILSQAATSMLAQANQSKQSVLALLQ